MKKQKWYGIALGVLGLSALLVVAVQKNEVKDNEQLYEAKFAFVAPKNWNKIAYGVVDADKEYGTLTKCILYTQDKASNQAEALRYALLSGADGIITGGMEENSDTEKVILEAQAEGVPVVYVDSDLPGSARSCYIGSDNYEIGKVAGEFLVQKTEGKANICVVVSYENNTNQQERLQGLKDAIADYPDIQISLIVEGKSNRLILEKELPKVLQGDTEIDSIVCAEGASARRCGQILRESGVRVEDYCIIGLDYYSDLAPQIENGTYAALVCQNQYEMGYQAVQYLKDVLDGKEREESVLHTEFELVTAENVAEYTENIEREEIQWQVF